MRFHNILLCQLHELLVSNFLAIQQNKLVIIPYSSFFFTIHIKKVFYVIRFNDYSGSSCCRRSYKRVRSIGSSLIRLVLLLSIILIQ